MNRSSNALQLNTCFLESSELTRFQKCFLPCHETFSRMNYEDSTLIHVGLCVGPIQLPKVPVLMMVAA